MVGEAVGHGGGERLVRQAFNHVAHLEIVLAIAIGREPPGSNVGPKGRGKRIVISFGDLVAEAGYITYGAVQKNRLVPRGVVEDKKSEQVSVAGIARLHVKEMEAADTARARVA